ncbi:MAG: ribosome biogenesis factor YjgA [Parashewanella sp.]
MKVIDEAELKKQPYDHNDSYISRTDFKAESDEIQKFGEKLAGLSKRQLEALELDEFMFDNLVKLKTIKPKTEAYRRHQQFIGKLMRNSDLDEIKAKYQGLLNKDNSETTQIALFERLRDDLLAGGDQEIQNLLETQPQLERQKLRQLVRQANKEIAKGGESKTAKELFKYLRSDSI